jgi:hypothetical protein
MLPVRSGSPECECAGADRRARPPQSWARAVCETNASLAMAKFGTAAIFERLIRLGAGLF